VSGRGPETAGGSFAIRTREEGADLPPTSFADEINVHLQNPGAALLQPGRTRGDCGQDTIKLHTHSRDCHAETRSNQMKRIPCPRPARPVHVRHPWATRLSTMRRKSPCHHQGTTPDSRSSFPTSRRETSRSWSRRSGFPRHTVAMFRGLVRATRPSDIVAPVHQRPFPTTAPAPSRPNLILAGRRWPLWTAGSAPARRRSERGDPGASPPIINQLPGPPRANDLREILVKRLFTEVKDRHAEYEKRT